MTMTAINEKKEECYVVTPISHRSTTGAPEVICPDCKRHFYWFKKDRTFYCSCGAKILVDEGK